MQGNRQAIQSVCLLVKMVIVVWMMALTKRKFMIANIEDEEDNTHVVCDQDGDSLQL